VTRTWTCQRVSGGLKCGFENSRRHTYCRACGKKRPASVGRPSKAKHIKGTYEEYIERQGGEYCGSCGCGRPASGRRLHRDHCHKTGAPRALLCFRCNTALPNRVDAAWLRAASDYLKRYEEEPTAEHEYQGRNRASLTIKIWNGTSLWLQADQVTTEEACRVLETHLPLKRYEEAA
jgi:hypothetical protein